MLGKEECWVHYAEEEWKGIAKDPLLLLLRRRNRHIDRSSCVCKTAGGAGGSVLYLNLESFGAADVYFSGDGDFDFSRVIYALAMSNGTTLMKMESSVKKDPSGVFFYSGCANALDMLELDQEVLDSLFEEIESLTQFEWIIVDMDFALEEKVYRQLERSHANIFVSDGRETANTKLERCLNAIEILAAQRKDASAQTYVYPL